MGLCAFLGTNGTWELKLAEAPDTPHLVLYYQVWIDGECVHNAPGPGSRSGMRISSSAELTVGLKDLLEQDPEAGGDGFLVFMSVGGVYTEALVELPKGKGATTWVRYEPLACSQIGADVVLLNYVAFPGASPVHFDEDGEASAIGDDGSRQPLEGRTGIVVRLRVD